MGRPSIAVVGYLSLDLVEHAGAVPFRAPGGAALYASLGARAAGGDVSLYASIGEDYPEGLLRAIEAAGIDISGVERRSGPTRCTRMSYGADGRRASHHHGDEAWWERTRALAPPSSFLGKHPDARLFTPLPAPLLADYAERSRGRLRTADTSEAFARTERAALLAAVAKLDVFAPSREETRLLLPELDDDAAARDLARRGPAVVQKRGPDGAFVVLPRNGTEIRYDAPVVAVADPTGAGDAFAGALTVAAAQGLSWPDIMQAAFAVAARAVAAYGPAGLGLDWAAVEHAAGW